MTEWYELVSAPEPLSEKAERIVAHLRSGWPWDTLVPLLLRDSALHGAVQQAFAHLRTRQTGAPTRLADILRGVWGPTQQQETVMASALGDLGQQCDFASSVRSQTVSVKTGELRNLITLAKAAMAAAQHLVPDEGGWAKLPNADAHDLWAAWQVYRGTAEMAL